MNCTQLCVLCCDVTTAMGLLSDKNVSATLMGTPSRNFPRKTFLEAFQHWFWPDLRHRELPQNEK